ncbi:anthranilate synthase/aminodeoxychorismate synthase-like glutamine amidotransferase [Salinibacter ruber]|uniref:anthranilate synthase component II n=1 Tax=Salinibacter ruber TaxID=146919 RepID=UPI002166E85E|nr:aminodeoxychorismate/anthranilate synthase component II [Salinibacter ruber]MCS3626669.1 anthranilate synthase/aminodeoxychorismate synthase-like glutamine amidotransferase [Salinibacter ruber]MCS4143495.1 anthranilate synthase/aminodeoxychorismate synthase-like glutamine amidotransferase [Salinibacter ruber]
MILVIDNYDSFTYNLVHLAGRETDDLEVVRNDDLTVADVAARDPDGILISPGPGHPSEAGITEPVIRELGATTPILGVCLGHQAIGEVYGGSVTQADELMHGKTSPVLHEGTPLFEDVDPSFDATRYHSLVINPDTFPHEDLEVTATTEEHDTIMALRHRTHPLYGIQFHPESVMTRAGPTIIANWLSIALDERSPAPTS